MSVKKNVNEFWKYFLAHQDKIIEALEKKDYETLAPLLQDMQDEVNRISGCSFFVEDVVEPLEMTFDPGPNKTSQYIARLLKNSAPKEVRKKWIINDCLVALSQKAIEAQIKIKEEVYTLPDFHVFYTIENENQMFSCQVYCPGYRLIGNTENKKEMSMYLLELAIGQTFYEAYIGFVDFIDQPPVEEKKFCNIIDFYDVIQETVQSKKWREYKSPLEIYSVYQPSKEIGHDSLRKDMKIIYTTHPLLVEETLGNGQDVLMDLKSKDGEYGFMYYANPFEGKENALFRQKLAKQLDEMVSSQQVGAVVGGAMGTSFSYIDWIVYDIEEFKKIFEAIKKQFKDKIELFYETY